MSETKEQIQEIPAWFNLDRMKRDLSGIFMHVNLCWQGENQDKFIEVHSYEIAAKISSTGTFRFSLDRNNFECTLGDESFEHFLQEIRKVIFNCIDTELLPDEEHSFMKGFERIRIEIRSSVEDDFLPTIIGDYFQMISQYSYLGNISYHEDFDYRMLVTENPKESYDSIPKNK